jgi:hypothetical protein
MQDGRYASVTGPAALLLLFFDHFDVILRDAFKDRQVLSFGRDKQLLYVVAYVALYIEKVYKYTVH